jgi:alginate O-acetyltransferase complex protein AlgI
MLFNRWSFFGFFTAVYVAYRLLPRRPQNVLLLAASYVFYSFWDYRFVSLLVISTLADFWFGQALGEASSPRRKRTLIRASVTLNLLFLGVFKYFDFFVGSFAALLTRLGINAHLPVLGIVLPVGISFYTFMSLSYTIDVYRGVTKPADSLLDYALFVAYFPHLVAGPIVRDTILLPQLQKERVVTFQMVQSGALLVLIGLTRKVAADYLANDVEAVFAAPAEHGSVTVAIGVVMFALQIYGDFAGYTDIARGISRMMGIELVRNFAHPYFATNITAFWRRWHMSLSSWLRDYLYIPLGGSRGPPGIGYRNLMLTMLLGGLWHGASWNFVIWGGMHGIALCVHKLWLRGRKVDEDPPRSIGTLASWAFTFSWVSFAWIFFRARTLAGAASVISRLAHFHGGVERSYVKHLVTVLVIVLVLDVPQYIYRDELAFFRWRWSARGFVYATLVTVAILIHTGRNVPFIYFQF